MQLHSDPNGLIDLHLHTTFSDGSLPPEEVVRLARSRGVGTLAITDHDSTGGVEPAIAAGIEADVQVVPGVEISAHDEDREVHMLAYGLELHKHPRLNELLAEIRESRRERLLAMIEALRAQGIDLDPADVLPPGQTAPARPHLARALIDGGHAGSIREVYDRFIGPDCEAYVGKMKVSLADAAQLVHDAGGVAILAHPGSRYKEAKLDEFMAMGLDGLEVYHARQARRFSKRLRAYAMSRDLLITGGSDFHGDGYPTTEIGDSTQPRHDFEALLSALRERSARPENTAGAQS